MIVLAVSKKDDNKIVTLKEDPVYICILNTANTKSPVNSSSLISFKSLLDQSSPRAAKTNLWALILWSAKHTVMSL